MRAARLPVDDRHPWCSERRAVPVRDGWVVAAESFYALGDGVRWDVRAEHRDGSRVPPGPNAHAEPAAEMARLVKVID